MAGASARGYGWHRDVSNGRLDFYYAGTRVGHIDATHFNTTQPMAVTGAFSATTTVTGGTGVTATTGDVQSTAGHLIALVGNAKLGAPAAFATTQPQGAVVMGGTSKSGIAPVGAVATSGAVFASDTVVRKIIADSTASNVET